MTPPLTTFLRYVVPAIVLLLGGCASEPAQMPPNVYARYSPEGLLAAFETVRRELGAPLVGIDVDQSSFPFVVYGVFKGTVRYQDMRDAVNSLSAYHYEGSVTASSPQGTVFALNMIPRSEYPPLEDMQMRLRWLVDKQLNDLRRGLPPQP